MFNKKNLKNRGKFFALFVILFVMVYACKDNDIPLRESINLNHTEVTFPADIQGSQSLKFNSTTDWEAFSDSEWIKIEDESVNGGEGEIIIDVLIDVNDSKKKREGKVIISSIDGEISKEIKIIQDGFFEEGANRSFYVKEDGTGNGQSWRESTGLQKALDSINPGDTIYVAEGTYNPSKIITKGDAEDNRDKTFEISENITILGGYPADAAGLSERDPSKYETILSGKLEGDENAYHTVVVSAPIKPDQEVNIEGVTIRDGASANRSSIVEINGGKHERWYGGGINISNAVVNITDVRITENNNTNEDDQSRAGGVMITNDSRVTFSGSLITKNEVASNHGGIRIDDSSVYMFDTEISDNKSGTAAGIYTKGSGAELYMYNSEVRDNESSGYGTGVYVSFGSIAYIVNSLIIDNVNTNDGKNGGAGLMLYKKDSEINLISSTVTGNEANYGAGILGLQGDYRINIFNSIVSGNNSKDDGSEIFESSGSLVKLFKSSIVDSKAFDEGGDETEVGINIEDILNSSLVPISSPATDEGLSSNDLTSDDDFPILSDEEYLDIDFNGNARSGNVMGAIAE